MLWRAIEAGPTLSFFETTFLTAMLSFRARSVDVAVLEVGLGGRLDATNVIEHPLVTAVTRIALDHTDKLGRTEEDIAKEKAAIAKRGAPMVLGLMPESIDRVCRDRSLQAGAWEIFGIGREILAEQLGPGALRVGLPGGALVLHPSLLGAHQLQNAATAASIAWLASRTLPNVDAPAILEGIARAQWPGRLEYVRNGSGDVLLDAAHNPDGAAALAGFLGKDDPREASSTALVFGAVADKSWKEMLRILAPVAAHRFYVEPGGRAAAPIAEMAALHPGECFEEVGEALSKARGAVGPNGLVVVAGSIFLAGNVRASLLDLPRDPPVAL
jgi:dihydrofolate synthase / folylpolyglutamate synthase